MPITETEIDGRIMALTAQRNDALDRCVLMHGVHAQTQDDLAASNAKVAELEAKIAELEKKE